MKTVTPTPDQAKLVRDAQAAGERDVWLVVEGYCPVCIEGGTRHDYAGPCRDWIAPLPWADLARECETCGVRGGSTRGPHRVPRLP